MIAKFLKHPLIVTIIGTGLVTFGGIVVSDYYQSRAWVRDVEFEVFRENHQRALVVLDELSHAMSARLFGMNKVFWVIKGTGTGDPKEVWNEYYRSVEHWNINLLQFNQRLARYVDKDCADYLMNDRDSYSAYQGGSPNTVHGHFLVAHKQLRELYDCVTKVKQCSESDIVMRSKKTETTIFRLGNEIKRFNNFCVRKIDLKQNN